MKRMIIGGLIVLMVITDAYLIYQVYMSNQTILSYGKDLPSTNNYSLFDKAMKSEGGMSRDFSISSDSVNDAKESNASNLTYIMALNAAFILGIFAASRMKS